MKYRSTYAMNLETPLVLPVLLLAILLAILSFPAQGAAETTDFDWQERFATPEEAGQALLAANQANDQEALVQILGPESQAILSSGDPAQDQASRQSFVVKYRQMNRWVTMIDGTQVLYIGADNYPFPIPLEKYSDSGWYFDTSAGADEILARRIGRNELLAIDACSAIASAQEFYFNDAHQYAQRIISTPGTMDGLYWPSSGANASSPLSSMEVFAQEALTSATPDAAPIIDGYEFRTLTAQGGSAPGGAKTYLSDGKLDVGFAVLAYPARYGDSGVMTFVLNRNGVVYQKDLGERTSEIAESIKTYDPSDGWIPAE
jgi:hypothetical protein